MRKYLVVDDNIAFAENLAEIVGDTGDEVVIAESGARAIELVKEIKFDALISDMRMPLMNGAEVVHRIRRIDPGLPALVITAYIADNELEAARQEGLVAVLPKPIPIARLLELISGAKRNGLVALVEDDVALADNLSEALREHGYATVTAHSVTDTERLAVRPFCAVADLRVPGGADGAALRKLTEKFVGLPAIVITAHASATAPMPAVERVFHKPFGTAELIAVIDRLHQPPPAV